MKTINFYNHGLLNDWTLNSFALVNKIFYGVGTAGNAFKMATDYALPIAEDLGNIGGWTLKMLASDNNGALYCVGTEDNVGKWENGNWTNEGKIGGWTLKMLAFDQENGIWAVGTEGNVGRWDGLTMLDQGNLGGWTLDSIAFDPMNPEQIFCVGTAHNLGVYNLQTKEMTSLDCNWTVKSAIIQENPYRIIGIGTAGNVGTCSL